MDRANRRAFLDAFALEHGFNPSDPEGWASITNVQIIAKKVKNNSISLSITHYPVLGLAIIDNIWRVAQESIAGCLPRGRLSRCYRQVYLFSPVSHLNNVVPFIEPKKDRTYWRDMENCRSFFTSYAQYRGFDPLNPANWASVNFADLRQYKVPPHLQLPPLPTPHNKNCVSHEKYAQGGRSVADVHGGLKNAIQMVYPAVAFSSA